MIPTLLSSSQHWVNLVKYFGVVSPFSILILWSLSFSPNFLWSLIFWYKSVNVFHIACGVSFPCRLETIWSQTPSSIICLAFATHFFHSAKFYASVVAGLRIVCSTNSFKSLSSIVASILSLRLWNLIFFQGIVKPQPMECLYLPWSMYGKFDSHLKPRNSKLQF